MRFKSEQLQVPIKIRGVEFGWIVLRDETPIAIFSRETQADAYAVHLRVIARRRAQPKQKEHQ